ncbi:MAG: hypothetical protein ACWGN7_01415 [Thermodesulfovibrionales bacterium]
MCDSETSRNAHRNLFGLKRSKYLICPRSPLECISDLGEHAKRIHVSCLWDGLLKLAVWKDSVGIEDVLLLLKSVGMGHADLAPFRGADAADIFPVLYYGKNFDVLRRICRRAKEVTETRLGKKFLNVQFHLVAEGGQKIIASSL